MESTGKVNNEAIKMRLSWVGGMAVYRPTRPAYNGTIVLISGSTMQATRTLS